MIALINRISHTETDKKADQVKEHFGAIEALKITAKEVRDGNGEEIPGDGLTPYYIIDKILNLEDLTAPIETLKVIIDKLGNISNELSKLEDAYSSKLIGAKANEKAFIEAELVKI